MRYPFDHGDTPDDETLEQVGRFLKSWQAPGADPTAKARLIERLMQTRSITPVPVRPPLKMSLRWTWLILRAQIRLINGVTWTASALVLALGTIVTLLSFQTPNGTTLPIILVAPAAPLALWLFAWGPLVRLKGPAAIAAQCLAVALPLLTAIAWMMLGGQPDDGASSAAFRPASPRADSPTVRSPQ